jgi:hypothetical protein
MTSAITNRVINTRKISFAMPAAATAIPVKPSNPAMIETTKNIRTQDNMVSSP